MQVWAIALVYGLMSDQMLSKQSDVPCYVRSDPTTGLGLASVALAIVVPVILGPVLVTVLHVLLRIIAVCLKPGASPASKDSRSGDKRGLSICSLVLLTMVFISTYSTSMIICELYMSKPSNTLLGFVLVKWVIISKITLIWNNHMKSHIIHGIHLTCNLTVGCSHPNQGVIKLWTMSVAPSPYV